MKRLASFLAVLTVLLVGLQPAHAAVPPIPPTNVTAQTLRLTDPGVFINVNGDTMRAARLAYGKARNGSASMKIADTGSSSAAGAYAGTGAAFDVNARSRSSQEWMRLELAGRISATQQSFWGSAGNPEGDYNTYNSNTVRGTCWTFGTGGTSLGGRLFRCASGTTDTLVFSATGIRYFACRYITTTGAGTIEWSLNGGAYTQINQNATAAWPELIVDAGSDGNHTLTWRRNSASGTVYVDGCEGYPSTPTIRINNMGWIGAYATDWADATTPARPAAAITTYAPDLTFVLLGGNEMVDFPNDVAGFKANLTTFVTAAKAGGGSCVLLTPTPIDPAIAPQATQDTFTQAVIDVAVANGCGAVNLSKVYGPYVASGSWWANQRHLNVNGYAEMGRLKAYLLAQ